jgi:hypothetical protein
MKSLAERAILVRVAECMNGVMKFDNDARNKLAIDGNAEKESLSVTKRLWPKKEIENLRGFIGSARALHRKMTLPWNDVGYRLLPNDQFFEFVKDMSAIRNKFNDARNNFKSNFYLYKAEGLKKMGEYADPSVYPSHPDDLDRMFQLDIMIRPCPNSNDIRVDLPEEVLMEMRNQTDIQIKRDVTDAIKELWDRFGVVIKHMVTKLDTGDPRYYRESMLTNISDLIKIIPSYNLTDDPELENSRKEIENVINNIKSIDDVKDDEQLRRDTVDKLTKLMDKFPQL